jgi:AdoMet-dependent heme synthase
MKPLRSPVKVSIDITSRCNLSCAHCRNSSRDATEELTFEEIRAVLDDLARQQVPRIGLSGGEPFIRADAPEIIRYAARHAAGRVFVSTNGTLVDDSLLRELEPARSRLTVKISLDGPRDIHDAIRGRAGAFDAASNAISLCVARGFRVEVTTTISRDNVIRLRELARHVMTLGCSRYNLVEIVPVGKATREMCLDAASRIRAREIAEQIKAEYAAPDDFFVIKIPFTGGNWHTLHCSGGISECGILSDGSVVGCRLLPHMREANVRTRSLSNLWTDPRSFAYFRHPQGFVPDPTCGACGHFATCGGGCRAYSFGLSGDPSARDPRCPYFPEPYRG